MNKFAKNFTIIAIVPLIFIAFSFFKRSKKIYVKDRVLSIVGNSDLHKHLFKEKDVVLIFWTSHCKPCVRAMPKIEEIAKDCGSMDFIALSPDTTKTADRNNIKFYNYSRKSSLSRLHIFLEYITMKGFYVASYPFYVVLDKDGYVKKYFVGKSESFIRYLRGKCK